MALDISMTTMVDSENTANAESIAGSSTIPTQILPTTRKKWLQPVLPGPLNARGWERWQLVTG